MLLEEQVLLIIKALVAVIHACLKAVAAMALALTSFALTTVLLLVGVFALLGFLGVTGVGGFSLVRWRRKRRDGPDDRAS